MVTHRLKQLQAFGIIADINKIPKISKNINNLKVSESVSGCNHLAIIMLAGKLF